MEGIQCFELNQLLETNRKCARFEWDSEVTEMSSLSLIKPQFIWNYNWIDDLAQVRESKRMCSGWRLKDSVIPWNKARVNCQRTLPQETSVCTDWEWAQLENGDVWEQDWIPFHPNWLLSSEPSRANCSRPDLCLGLLIKESGGKSNEAPVKWWEMWWPDLRAKKVNLLSLDFLRPLSGRDS